jgi:hypothetical protein
MQDHHLKKTQLQLNRTLIRPITMYGVECWALSRSEEQNLDVFRKGVLRTVYGQWHAKFNYTVVPKFCEQTSRLRFSHQNEEKSSYKHMSGKECF